MKCTLQKGVEWSDPTLQKEIFDFHGVTILQERDFLMFKFHGVTLLNEK